MCQFFESWYSFFFVLKFTLTEKLGGNLAVVTEKLGGNLVVVTEKLGVNLAV